MTHSNNGNVISFKYYFLRIEAAIAFCLFAVAALPFYMQIPNDLIGNRDEYKHILVAQSLAESEGLKSQVYDRIQYPPGWGTVIYFITILFRDHLRVAHVLTSLLAWLTGPLVYIYLRSLIKPVLALAIGGLTSVHFLTVCLGDTLMSEPIFGVTWFACLFWLRRPTGLHWCGWLIAGTIIALCMSFRTIGISLWIGTICYLVFNSKNKLRTKLLYMGCLTIVPILCLAFLNSAQPTMGIRPDMGYGGQFFGCRIVDSHRPLTGIILRTVKDVPAHTRDLMEAIIPIKIVHTSQIVRLIWITIVGLIMALALLGWVKRISQNPTPLEYALACYLGICYLWPYINYPRFFWPVVPLIWYYACTSLTEQIIKQRSDLTIAIIAFVIIIAILISFSTNLAITTSHRLFVVEHEMALKDAVVEAKKISNDPIATISYFKISYHFPNVSLCPLTYSTKKEHHQDRIQKCKAGFLLVEPQHQLYFNSLLNKEKSRYELIFQRFNVKLWKIKKVEF